MSILFFSRKIKNGGRVGVGEKHVLIDTVRQAEHNTTISPDTHKVFTVQFNRKMKLSLHLVKCLLLSTSLKQDEISTDYKIK